MIIIREMTDCYKCETKIMAEVGAVHPLCANCGQDFESWFDGELRKINK